jgi:hypothetical protein
VKCRTTRWKNKNKKKRKKEEKARKMPLVMSSTGGSSRLDFYLFFSKYSP